MALLLPGLFVRKSLVRQAGEAEACVADPDALTFVSHYLGGDVYQGALSLWHHLPSAFSTMDKHQLMQFEACVAAVHHFLVKQLSAHRAGQKSLLSTVGLTDQAI
jgi:hypothetical protein